MAERGLSVIDVPDEYKNMVHGKMPSVAMMEDGGLGFASVEDTRLYLWAWQEAGAHVSSGWKQWRVIELTKLLPNPDKLPLQLCVVGFTEGTGTIFLSNDCVGIYTIQIKSGRVTKVGKKELYCSVMPYTGFCLP